MRKLLISALFSTLSGSSVYAAQEISTFHAYVDTDLCARLMLGPVTQERIQCSVSTFKDGSGPVLVNLRNNMVLTPNKEKLLKPLMGQIAEASGEIKVKNGTVKLEDIKAVAVDALPPNDPSRKMLDVRQYRTDKSAQLHEKIRHELAMMPYISEFDFVSFTQAGSDVILTGWTVRDTNRYTAYDIVKDIAGVETVINNIDVLPLSSMDMQIRAKARVALQRFLPRYFWGNGSDIKIIVKNGQIVLLGMVATKADSDLAFIQCNALSGVYKVFNLLRVASDSK